MTAGKLTDKQAKFVEEYCVDLNATQAAIRAGYSEDTAGVIGYENLKKPYIKEAIHAKQEEHAEQCFVSIGSLTHELNVALDMAVAQGDANALRAVIMSKAKIHGLEVNKNEHAGPNNGPIKTSNQFTFLPVGPDYEPTDQD